MSSFPSLDAAQFWCVPSPSPLHRAGWGDESVVFHTETGQLHLLDAFGDAVLGLIAAQPATLAAIANALHQRFALTPETIRARLPVTVRDFESHGLIARSAR